MFEASAHAVSEGVAQSPVFTINEAENVYDTKWFPKVDSCALLTVAREQPLHLWDGYAGHFRASYVCMEASGETPMFGAISCAFSPDGSLITGMSYIVKFYQYY